LNINFVKVSINNLATALNPTNDMLPMSNYKFVTKQALSSLDTISNNIKTQIVEINKGKQKELKEVRKQEKELYREMVVNKKLKEELN
jgi:hypothetical protein